MVKYHMCWGGDQISQKGVTYDLNGLLVPQTVKAKENNNWTFCLLQNNLFLLQNKKKFVFPEGKKLIKILSVVCYTCGRAVNPRFPSSNFPALEMNFDGTAYGWVYRWPV